MSKLLAINGFKSPIGIHVTKNLKEWFVGLSNETTPLNNKGLLLKFCNQIQMKTCQIPLDVVFVKSNGVVVSVYRNVLPKSSNIGALNALHCYELPTGTIDQYSISVGSKLNLIDL